jgi:O-antigen/teichoic acid export membrane protein
MRAQQSSGPRAKVLGVWQRNHDLLRNAGSLAATTGLTSVFGFVYWIVAAREFSQEAVGYGSAAISAMTLLGTVGMFGLGTMLIGELPRRRSRGGLMAAAIIASGLGSLVLGFAFPLLAGAFGGHFPELSGTPARLAIFTVGVALTGASLVFDEGTIGLMRGGVQLSRNLAMSLFKLIALPVTAVVLYDGFGVGIELAWVIGTALSLVPAAVLLVRAGSRVLHRPDWGLLRRLGRVAMAHNWLNLAITTPPKLIPVLVTVVVSPSANAAFYVAWMLASFLFMVPGHLSTVLFAIASASPELIAEKLRFVLRFSLLIGLPMMAALAIGAHFALNIFGASYAILATVPLWTLIVGYLPSLPKAQYIAVCRATGKVTKAATVLTVAAACELAAVIIGGRAGGLDGLSFAYLGVIMIEGLVTAPTVLRAAYARSKAATEGWPAVRTISSDVRAATGPLAALATLATASVSEGHTLDVATEVWRTGGFPAIQYDGDRSRRAAQAVTTIDLYGSQPTVLAGLAGVPAERLSYRHRQQAGMDALIALATPAIPTIARENPADPSFEERHGSDGRRSR